MSQEQFQSGPPSFQAGPSFPEPRMLSPEEAKRAEAEQTEKKQKKQRIEVRALTRIQHRYSLATC